MAPPTMPRWPATQTFLPVRSKLLVIAGEALGFLFHRHHVGRDHFLDHLAEGRGVFPAEDAQRLRWIAQQQVHLCWTEIARIDLDQRLASLRVDADFIDARTFPGDGAA